MPMLSKSDIEYVGHGLNWLRGCGCGCEYCYAWGIAHRFNVEPTGGWTAPDPRFDNPAARLRDELSRKRSDLGILMASTSHDPAGSDWAAAQIPRVIDVLAEFGLTCQTLFLSKRPMAVMAAIQDSKTRTRDLRIGSSVTTLGSTQAREFEPGSESPATRLAAVRLASELGYETWLSIEPPLPDVWIMHLLRGIDLEALGRPWIVMGRLSYRGANQELRAWSTSRHWEIDRDGAIEYLKSLGYIESLTPATGTYWVKKNLQDA